MAGLLLALRSLVAISLALLLEPQVHDRVGRSPDDLDEMEVLLDEAVEVRLLSACEELSDSPDRRRTRRTESRMAMAAGCGGRLGDGEYWRKKMAKEVGDV